MEDLPACVVDDRKHVHAPIAVLRKERGRFTRFDFTDETGRTIPLPTRSENGEISALTLSHAAHRIIGWGHAGIEAELQLVATADKDLALAIYEYGYRAPTAVFAEDEDAPLRKRLMDDDRFRWLIRVLAYGSILVAQVEDTGIERRILKLSYDEQVADVTQLRKGGALKNRVAALAYRLGWRGYLAEYLSPHIGARSYHFELHAPPGMELLEAGLTGGQPVHSDRHRVHLYDESADEAPHRGLVRAVPHPRSRSRTNGCDHRGRDHRVVVGGSPLHRPPRVDEHERAVSASTLPWVDCELPGAAIPCPCHAPAEPRAMGTDRVRRRRLRHRGQVGAHHHESPSHHIAVAPLSDMDARPVDRPNGCSSAELGAAATGEQLAAAPVAQAAQETGTGGPGRPRRQATVLRRRRRAGADRSERTRGVAADRLLLLDLERRVRGLALGSHGLDRLGAAVAVVQRSREPRRKGHAPFLEVETSSGNLFCGSFVSLILISQSPSVDAGLANLRIEATVRPLC